MNTDVHDPANLTTLSLELASRCNLRCVMCSHPGNPRPVEVLSMEAFRAILDKAAAAPIRRLYLNMGEPFMNNAATRMIAHARQKGLAVFVSTNGQLLGESQIEHILRTGVEMVKFSIEGYDAEAYGAIRRGGDFLVVTRNAARLKQRRDETSAPTRIRISTILMKGNENLVEFVKYWGRFCDEIEYTTITDHIGLADNRAAALTPKWDLRRRCPQVTPYQELNVLANGDVVICCVDFHARCVLGNLLRQDLGEIWDSPRFREIREKAAAGDMAGLEPCRGCHIADYSAILSPTLRRETDVLHEAVLRGMQPLLQQVVYHGGAADCPRCGRTMFMSFAGNCLACLEGGR